MSTKQLDIRFQYSIRMLVKPEYSLKDYVIEAIEDLLTLNNQLTLETFVGVQGNPKISFSYKSDVKTSNFHGHIGTFSFDLQLEYPLDKYDTMSYNNVEEYCEHIEAEISLEFNIYIQSLILMSGISYPGALEITNGNCFINNESKNNHVISSMASFHRITLEYAKEIGWPTIKKLPILKVFYWMRKNKFSFEKRSTSKTERALIAFSYLFEGGNHYDFDLFWSLMGIEALYCNSKEGISDQIFTKTQVLLGPVTEFKKRLKEMYNFRSRFIHGDMDIPSSLIRPYISEDENFDEKNFQATTLSIAILTATLQEMVLLDMGELQFKHVLHQKYE